MFVYSVRASTIRFFSIIVLTVAVLVGIVVISNASETSISTAAGGVSLTGVKTQEDRIAFITQFGIKANPESEESEEFRVPESFDRVIAGYNEIQKRQGLDLTKYKNKKVRRYTYEVEGYEGYDGTVLVNLIIYKGTVIACDISSGAPDGFVKPLVRIA